MLRYTKNSVYKLLKDFTILEYIPRNIQNPKEYINWLNSENYRFRDISLTDILLLKIE